MRKRIPKATKDEVIRLSKGICQKCNRAPGVTVHHVEPVALGGTNEQTNLINICRACHEKIHPFMRYPKDQSKDKAMFKNEIGTYYQGGDVIHEKSKHLAAVIKSRAQNNPASFSQEIGKRKRTEQPQGMIISDETTKEWLDNPLGIPSRTSNPIPANP